MKCRCGKLPNIHRDSWVQDKIGYVCYYFCDSCQLNGPQFELKTAFTGNYEIEGSLELAARILWNNYIKEYKSLVIQLSKLRRSTCSSKFICN